MRTFQQLNDCLIVYIILYLYNIVNEQAKKPGMDVRIMGEMEKSNLTDPFAYMKALAAIAVFIMHVQVFSGMYGYGISESNWFMKASGHGAVWVFFFLSGYFNIKGFLGADPRYRLEPKGILAFYIRRFIKVLFPVWCFYLIALTISEPSFLQIFPETLWHLLTFTYSGEPGCTSIAATWYVSSLTWLYFFTPLIAWICRKLERSDRKIHIIAFILLAALLGLAERVFLLISGVDWTQGVCVPFYCNLDLYICGAFAYLLSKRIRFSPGAMVPYALSLIVYSLLLLIHNRIYYLADHDVRYMIIHGYFMPTVYIAVMSIVCILVQSAGYRYQAVSPGCVRRNPFRLIDAFSLISFQFYLIHNMVLFHLSTFLTGETGAEYNRNMLIFGFILSIPLSLLFKRAATFRLPGEGAAKNSSGIAYKDTVSDRVYGDENGSAT